METKLKMKIVLDLEGNNLREQCTVIHCVCFKELNVDPMFQLHNMALSLFKVCDFKQLLYDLHVTEIIGHNILGYDIPVLKKLLGINFDNIKLTDTFVMSQLLNPDRTVPEGCPINKPHSLEALGWRLGHTKIQHGDWSVFDENMLNRCISDVLITEDVYNDFMKQMAEDA